MNDRDLDHNDDSMIARPLLEKYNFIPKCVSTLSQGQGQIEVITYIKYLLTFPCTFLPHEISQATHTHTHIRKDTLNCLGIK